MMNKCNGCGWVWFEQDPRFPAKVCYKCGCLSVNHLTDDVKCQVYIHDKNGFVMAIDLDNRTSDVIKCLIDLRDGILNE